MPTPGRPDLDDFVVNSARDRGIPVVIATISDLLAEEILYTAVAHPYPSED